MSADRTYHGVTRPPALPAWWRRALIALATVVLCSCQAPLVISDLSDVVIDDAAAPTNVGPVRRTEVRELSPELLAMSRPLEGWPASADFSHAGCPTCGQEPGGGATCVSDLSGNAALVGPSNEYLCDGGDFGLPVGVRADWTVDGLEQEDAVAHYDTLDGRIVVTPSNRVCVYAPRFAAVRRVEGLQAHERRQLIDIAAEEVELAAAKAAGLLVPRRLASR